MKRFHFLAALFAGLLWVAGCAAAAPVTVAQGAYHGWAGAYRLSNGVVDVVVVPSIGRIMAFQFTGRPQSSPLFNNPDWAGKPPPPVPDPADPKTFPTDWHNYGGDKLWPSEQGQWPQHQPVAWPPDPDIEYGPFRVTRIPNGLRLTGPPDPYFAVRVVRDITLAPRAARLDLHDRFIKAASAAGDKDGFPIGIWSISQVRGDGTVFLPINTQGQFPGVGFTPLGDDPKMVANWRVQGDLLAVTRPDNMSSKVGVDDRRGWMAFLFGGDLLFSEHFTRPTGTYPDKNTNAQVYTNGGPPYIEMEVLGPMVNLRAGQTLSRSLSWRLERLPHAPNGDAAARALVRAAMARM